MSQNRKRIPSRNPLRPGWAGNGFEGADEFVVGTRALPRFGHGYLQAALAEGGGSADSVRVRELADNTEIARGDRASSRSSAHSAVERDSSIRDHGGFAQPPQRRALVCPLRRIGQNHFGEMLSGGVNCFEACHLVGRHRMVFEDVRRVEFGVCHAISKSHTRGAPRLPADFVCFSQFRPGTRLGLPITPFLAQRGNFHQQLGDFGIACWRAS